MHQRSVSAKAATAADAQPLVATKKNNRNERFVSNQFQKSFH
jgi:hypothetical protein